MVSGMGLRIAASTVVGERYRIVRELASGSQATVYEGELLNLGKRVALKFLTRDGGPHCDAVARFRREMRALAATASDHTVQVFDVGDDPELGLYMVMELLDGESLGARLTRETRLSVDEAVVIGVQTAWALENAHGKGIVHRDLKPDNLFLVTREAPAVCVKLLDFGVAKLNRGVTTSITPCGITLGTPQYMSPEQVVAVRDIDERTDIWALGAVLFEALSGRPAIHDCGDMTRMLGRICTDGPPPLRSVAPHVPAAVAAVVDGMLVRDRTRRIQDARAVASMLLEAAPDSVAAMFMPSSNRLRAVAVASSASRSERSLRAASAIGNNGGVARHSVDFSSMDFEDIHTSSQTAAREAAQAAVPAWAVATVPSIVALPSAPRLPAFDAAYLPILDTEVLATRPAQKALPFAHIVPNAARPRPSRVAMLSVALALVTAVGAVLVTGVGGDAHAGPRSVAMPAQ